MTFLHFVRRAHLYMGLCLLPWVIMFGVSTIPLNHQSGPEQAEWVALGNQEFDAAVPAGEANLRPLGRQMMDAAGLQGGFFVNRAGDTRVNVYHPDFRGPVRLTYDVDSQRLTAERRRLTFRSFISALHTRGGYDLDGIGDSIWALIVDIVSVSLILWIASGVYMWWQLPSTRRWGWMALGAGSACFAIIIFSL